MDPLVKTLEPEDLELLLPLLTEHRIETMRRVLDQRTRSITVVLEGFSDMHNTSAVLRTCDAFGIQDAHVVTGPRSDKFRRPNKKITRGSSRWLTLHKWGETPTAIQGLRQRGYSIAVADVEGNVNLDELPLDRPTSIWFGNEHDGASEQVKRDADWTFRIPMLGFVESFNVSVAASLVLYHASRNRLRKGGKGDLSAAEKEALFLRWVYEDVRHGSTVLPRLRARRRSSN